LLIRRDELPALVGEARRGELEHSGDGKFAYLHSRSLTHLSQWSASTVSGGAATDPRCSPRTDFAPYRRRCHRTGPRAFVRHNCPFPAPECSGVVVLIDRNSSWRPAGRLLALPLPPTRLPRAPRRR